MPRAARRGWGSRHQYASADRPPPRPPRPPEPLAKLGRPATVRQRRSPAAAHPLLAAIVASAGGEGASEPATEAKVSRWPRLGGSASGSARALAERERSEGHAFAPLPLLQLLAGDQLRSPRRPPAADCEAEGRGNQTHQSHARRAPEALSSSHDLDPMPIGERRNPVVPRGRVVLHRHRVQLLVGAFGGLDRFEGKGFATACWSTPC